VPVTWHSFTRLLLLFIKTDFVLTTTRHTAIKSL
jgi:hypothetical protein